MDSLPTYDENALSDVSASLGIRMLVAFGSYATGTPVPTHESDLDLAVLDDKRFSASRFLDVREGLQDIFDAAIDLAFLHRADPLFRYEIFRAGILLYGDVDDFLNYRSFAHRAFLDSQDLRDLERVLFRMKMAYLERELHATP